MFYVCSLRAYVKEGPFKMIRTASPQYPDETEPQVKDLKRLLAKAEQTIRRLQEKLTHQKQQIRELQAEAKHEENLAAEREALKAEIADLRGETSELTRANREHVVKNETLRAENTKLMAEAKARRSNGVNVRAPYQRTLEPV
jgi:DNA repair exonuclease SbcCD ATPase subunit